MGNEIDELSNPLATYWLYDEEVGGVDRLADETGRHSHHHHPVDLRLRQHLHAVEAEDGDLDVLSRTDSCLWIVFARREGSHVDHEEGLCPFLEGGQRFDH